MSKKLFLCVITAVVKMDDMKSDVTPRTKSWSCNVNRLQSFYRKLSITYVWWFILEVLLIYNDQIYSTLSQIWYLFSWYHQALISLSRFTTRKFFIVMVNAICRIVHLSTNKARVSDMLQNEMLYSKQLGIDSSWTEYKNGKVSNYPYDTRCSNNCFLRTFIQG